MPEHSAIIKEVGGTLIERVPDLMKGDIVPQQICAHSLCDCVLVFSTGCVLVGLGSFFNNFFSLSSEFARYIPQYRRYFT